MELSEIREKIDAVDDQLLDLFLQRMDLSEEVAAYKNEHHLPILNKERERAILAKVTEKSGERERYAYHLFSTLFELARSRQAELIDAPTRVGAQIKAALADMNEVFPQTGLVACQGVEGANSQVACDRLLPRGNIVYVKTFQAVVSAVESGLCKFGVLPIENSSNGSVRAVYELLQDHNLTIVRSTRLCIRHELLALPGVKMGDITEIYSHEQAIGQCSKFLNSLNGVRVIPCDNTAAAAKSTGSSICIMASSMICSMNSTNTVPQPGRSQMDAVVDLESLHLFPVSMSESSRGSAFRRNSPLRTDAAIRKENPPSRTRSAAYPACS